MVFGIAGGEFDPEVLLKLEEDGLLRRKERIVYLAHDIYEDWALEEFINESFIANSNDLKGFFNSIGCAPALRRSYRLWLLSKIKNSASTERWVLSILNNNAIEKHWLDETITAILQAHNAAEYLNLVFNKSTDADVDLFIRFSFLLRVSCQVPYNNASVGRLNKDAEIALILKPSGAGWPAIIELSYRLKESLPRKTHRHVIAILNEWSMTIHVDDTASALKRRAGLLALYLANNMESTYGNDDILKKLCRIVINVSSSIQGEIKSLIQDHIHEDSNFDRREFPEQLCNLALKDFRSVHICKYLPDLVIDLARAKFLVDASNKKHGRYASSVEVEDCFNLGHKWEYLTYPASPYKGPFSSLLRSHPIKGLKFIVHLLNDCADAYAHSTLDSRAYTEDSRLGCAAPTIPTVQLRLDEGIEVTQYYSPRLWEAYRGISVVPDILQCGLMALENFVIECVEYSDDETIEFVFNYILKKSNSVMATAILASVATGFPEKAAIHIMPILEHSVIYQLDSRRSRQEAQLGLLDSFGADRSAYREMYAKERRSSNEKPWRNKNLEFLILQIQLDLPELKKIALESIDQIHAEKQIDEIRFLLLRIDSRQLKAVKIEGGKYIGFEPKKIAPDLQAKQQAAQKGLTQASRFAALNVWANCHFDLDSEGCDYYVSWQAALLEAKSIEEDLEKKEFQHFRDSYKGSIVTTACVVVRDHGSELSPEDLSWCFDVVTSTIVTQFSSLEARRGSDYFNRLCLSQIVTVTPLFLKYCDASSHTLTKQIILTGILFGSAESRIKAAISIRNSLWKIDEQFATICLHKPLEYARLLEQHDSGGSYFPDNDEQAKGDAHLFELQNAICNEINSYSSVENLEDLTKKNHSLWYLLESALMIPYSSPEEYQLILLYQILDLLTREEGENSNHKINGETLEYVVNCIMEARGDEQVRMIKFLAASVKSSPNFVSDVMLKLLPNSDKSDRHTYWNVLKELEPHLIEVAKTESLKPYIGNGFHSLISTVLLLEVPWGYGTDGHSLDLGAELLLTTIEKMPACEMTIHALAKLTFYFPSLFIQESLLIIAQKVSTSSSPESLIESSNCNYYLEMSIQRYLMEKNSNQLELGFRDSMLSILDVLVDKASSRAYYLRERVVRTKIS